ncbi:MAG: hypothetical protein JKY67_10315, partial [Pseudomonadales bacterium]|nr:hypothetical protein [Pseudomonadales bacterium]
MEIDGVQIGATELSIQQLSLLQSTIDIKRPLKEFVICILEQTKKDEQSVISRQHLISQLGQRGLKNSNSLVMRRLGELKKLGVSSHSETQAKGRRKPLVLYTIDNIAPLLAFQTKPKIPIERRTKSFVKTQLDLFRNDAELVLLEPFEKFPAVLHERIWSGILDAGMRLSARDKRVEINTRMRVAGEPLQIKT